MNTLPTHIHVQTTCKVNLASDDPFKADNQQMGKTILFYLGDKNLPILKVLCTLGLPTDRPAIGAWKAAMAAA